MQSEQYRRNRVSCPLVKSMRRVMVPVTFFIYAVRHSSNRILGKVNSVFYADWCR